MLQCPMPSENNHSSSISSNAHNGTTHNLKISNLPQNFNDMAIVSGLKQLMDPIGQQTHFKKIIFNRTRSGKAFLFVKFAQQNHMNKAYSIIHNKSMLGHPISVQIINDDDITITNNLLSMNSGSTIYRSGFTVQYSQDGKERIITIIPTTNKETDSIQFDIDTSMDYKMNDDTPQTLEAQKDDNQINDVKPDIKHNTQTVSENHNTVDKAMETKPSDTLGKDTLDMDKDDIISKSPIAAHFNDCMHIDIDYSKKKENTVIKKQKTKLKYRLCIENININIGDHQLKTKFEKFGAVSSANVIRNTDTNASKGFGFVTFKSLKASKRAITSMNNTSWFGQKLRVTNVADNVINIVPNHKSVTNRVKKRGIKPRDPRLKRKQKQQQIPPPPPPKPPITHNFSSKPSMECVDKPKTSLSTVNNIIKAPSSTPPNTNQSKTNNIYNNNKYQQTAKQYIQPIQSVPSAAFYPNGVNGRMSFGYSFRPLVIPGNTTTSSSVHQPPIIPGSLTQFNKLISQMRQSQTATNSVQSNVAALDDIKWNHGVLLGKLPDYTANEYHKLRFQIEQRVGKPITAIHVLEKPIASSSNPSDIFTCCAIFDSETEMKNAFDKLKDCMIMNQSIIFDMASKYMHQMEASVIKPDSTTPSTETVNHDDTADIQVKSMSISPSPIHQRSFSPPSSAHSVSSKHAVPERDSQRSKPDTLIDDQSRNGRRRGRDSTGHSRYKRHRRRSPSRERYYHRYRDRPRLRHRPYNRDRDRDRRPVKYSGRFDQRSKRHILSYSRSPSWSRSRSYRRDKREKR